jgi:hypothetical protein
VGARVICGGLHPDHSTIARFVTRHEQAVKGLLVQSLVACARQGLVSVDVVAGDGTMVKANASMAANATAAQLDAGIAGLEELIEAEVAAWMTQARAEDAADDTLFGDGDGDGDGDGPRGGGPSALAALTGKLVRRQKARARLAAEATARQEAAEAGRAETVARLQEQIARNLRWEAREEAACQARVDDYAARAAAKAAAGSGKRPDGRVPVEPRGQQGRPPGPPGRRGCPAEAGYGRGSCSRRPGRRRPSRPGQHH